MLITEIQCCDYHAAPLGERAPIWAGGVDVKDWPLFDQIAANGQRQGFIDVPWSSVHQLHLYLEDALTHDHDCEERWCDIAVAMAEGLTFVAYDLLSGATDAHATEAVVQAAKFNFGAEAVDQVLDDGVRGQWDAWDAYVAEYGRKCESCNGYTYAEPHWEPSECGMCGAALPMVDDDDDDDDA